jgi:octaheme c-type cytochrome (tetrathionate reductase family)
MLLLLSRIGLAADKSWETGNPKQPMPKQPVKWSTADHSKFEVLNQNFEKGPDITKACLSCHSEAEEQLHKTIHWTWQSPYDDTGDTGKAGYSVNNFCVSANKMQDTDCNSCHIGWDAKNDGINCLLCHSQKNIQWKDEFKDYAFFMETGDVDIANDIQATIRDGITDIGLPTRQNCGTCHFNGGGGEAVKHGDLDASLINPEKHLDVHMGIDSQNFNCTRCHTTAGHRIAGRVYSTPASAHRKSLVEDDLVPKIMCESCHTAAPHKSNQKANDHTDKVACQSCHIPKFARSHPTLMWWDWSKAGKKKDGKYYSEKGEYDRFVYKSYKGEFDWDRNVTPHYFWYNGSITTLTIKDPIDPSKPVPVSWPTGSLDNDNSRIFPFKLHRGKQPYDKQHNRLLAALLSSDAGGFWKTYDWEDAITRGMSIMDLPYSGQMGFVETVYVYPTTHMVAPAENAVKCSECHIRSAGRLANLAGFYMPGRDFFKLLDLGGWSAAALSLIAVLVHAFGRVIRRNGKKEE